MSFLMKGNEVLEKYNEIWKKIINSIKKESDRESVYNEKYLKIKSKTSKEGSQSICLSAILIDLVYKTDKSYYPQVFLEECKYIVKEKKMFNYITDDITISSNDSDYSD